MLILTESPFEEHKARLSAGCGVWGRRGMHNESRMLNACRVIRNAVVRYQLEPSTGPIRALLLGDGPAVVLPRVGGGQSRHRLE